ncbi:hypothetical protein CI593_18255 [Fischerella thermalis CCMEE 5194]|nr:hypothetical protein CI593_18255 [Fischerella thermalis CCMEE 5194]
MQTTRSHQEISVQPKPYTIEDWRGGNRSLKQEFAYPIEDDDGWVITLVYDATYNCSDVVILDGKNLEKGAIARLHLKHHIPYGLHGSFTSDI